MDVFKPLFEKEENHKSKTKTIGFRVDEDTYQVFEKHAIGYYKGKQKAMETILDKYLRSVALRRDVSFYYTNLIIPKFLPGEYDENLQLIINAPYKEDIIYNDKRLKDYPHPFDMVFTNDLKTEKGNILYPDVKKQIKHYYPNSKIEDFYHISFYINNCLDEYSNGIYKAPYQKNKDTHRGLIIKELNGVIYYIRTTLFLSDEYHDNLMVELITRDNAFKLAVDCNNIKLANYINDLDSSNDLIKKSVKMLEDRKSKLLNEVDELDEIVKNLESNDPEKVE